MQYAFETERTYIRALEEKDSEEIYEFYNDIDILENYLDPYSAVRPMSKINIERYITDISRSQIGMSILDKKNETLIGLVTMVPDYLSGVSTFNIIISKDYRGSGFGSEVIKEFIKIIFINFNMRKITLFAYSFNKAINLYKRIGFIEEARLKKQIYRRGQYNDIVYMSLEKQNV